MGRGELTMVSLVAVSTVPVTLSRYFPISRRRRRLFSRLYRPRPRTMTSSVTAQGDGIEGGQQGKDDQTDEVELQPGLKQLGDLTVQKRFLLPGNGPASVTQRRGDQDEITPKRGKQRYFIIANKRRENKSKRGLSIRTVRTIFLLRQKEKTVIIKSTSTKA